MREISCVIPVYNGERFLAEAIDSALAQTHPPVEILVIDDGSTDGTAEVAAGYRSHVTYCFQEHTGPATARNRGIETARGDLVAILDADDRWHPEKLARQAARFAARPELGISLTHMRNVWVPELAHEEQQLRGTFASPLSIQSLVARRELFATLGLFDVEAWHKDVIGWLIRAYQHGAVVDTIPEVLVDRRIHQMNLSRRRDERDADELLTLAKILIDSQRRGRSTQATGTTDGSPRT